MTTDEIDIIDRRIVREINHDFIHDFVDGAIVVLSLFSTGCSEMLVRGFVYQIAERSGILAALN